MSRVVDEHRQYLADELRVSAFRRAISETVRPGDVILDLGAGTGILGLMACRAGAKRVYSVEAGGMIGLAREICRANGFADRVTFIKGLSTQVDLPEKLDVVLTDQIGHFGFEAGVIGYLSDARDRFLKSGGVLVPSRVDLCVAAVEYQEMFEQIEFWNNGPAGFDFRPARALAVNTGYPVRFRPEHILGGPAMLDSIDLATATTAALSLETSIAAERPGTLHGIGGWFSAQLSSTVTMTNSPLAADSISRRNVFFPIDRPVDIAKGDSIRIRMHIVPAELVVTWKVDVCGGGAAKGSFTHSTWKGMLMCEEDLRRTEPGFVPKLSPRGEARLSVVSLCDGRQSLAEIEQEVYRRHQKLFRSPQEAAAFVAEVVTRYSV